MTNKEQIVHSLLPRAEGLLLGTIGGLELDNFNREGAAKTLTDAIALLHKVRLLLEPELNSEPSPQLQQTPVSGSLPLNRIIVYLECLHSYLSSEETFDFANDTCLNEADDLQTFINSLRQISR